MTPNTRFDRTNTQDQQFYNILQDAFETHMTANGAMRSLAILANFIGTIRAVASNNGISSEFDHLFRINLEAGEANARRVKPTNAGPSGY